MSEPRRQIYCCACKRDVQARLTSGAEIYPHRPDLRTLPFWKCDTCAGYVGCHHKTENRTKPLGVIPTPEIREARKTIHALLDPLWKGIPNKRKCFYIEIGKKLGRRFHTADIRSIEEANRVLEIVELLSREVTCR